MVKKILFSSLVFLMLVAPITAAVMVRLSLSDLVEKSDLVIVGEVLETQSYWGINSWGDELIYTDVTVVVTDALKGAHQQEVVVTIEGGQVGDIGLEPTHMPTFAKGEKAVLFLQQREAGLWVAGGPQGKWLITNDGLMTRGKIALVDFKARIKNLLK
ncbi:MAG: hypothetical protein HYR55_15670 [Acidobacteria bacterium]|nr:hypothetical protein [Acidobacteriota bacterium]MBI3655964.1 hypothetical protein [Acidobacteriota bacterium]